MSTKLLNLLDGAYSDWIYGLGIVQSVWILGKVYFVFANTTIKISAKNYFSRESQP